MKRRGLRDPVWLLVGLVIVIVYLAARWLAGK